MERNSQQQIFHILNGDCLDIGLSKTIIAGEKIVCRECLIDGPLEGNTLNDFWRTRSVFIAQEYHESTEGYATKVIAEFEKLQSINEEDDVYLWFENDLFCQVNYWFILSLFWQKRKTKNVFLVSPINSEEKIWQGFGNADANKLIKCFESAQLLSIEDIQKGADLWNAYRTKDVVILDQLTQTNSTGFPMLKNIHDPLLDLFPADGSLSRPVKKIAELMKIYPDNFEKLYHDFFLTEGVYGWGDSQVKRWVDQLK